MGSKPLCASALKSGSRIGLLAPAGPLVERDEVRRAGERCRALGFEPVVGRQAYARHGYLAGTDAERLEDLNGALADPSLDAVWCLRGGFGTTRLLSRINYQALADNPKVLLGFSDITALLNATSRQTGLVTFHGPVARGTLTSFSRDAMERVVTQPRPAGLLPGPPVPGDVLIPREGRVVPIGDGVAEGPLFGGNLTIMASLVGTPYLPHFDGAILFLEDIAEELYSVDRMLSQLRLAGILDRLAGVAIGQFTDMKRETPSGALGFEEVLETYLGPLGIPAAFGFPIGHVDDQWTLPLGIDARLDAGAGTLELLQAAVTDPDATP